MSTWPLPRVDWLQLTRTLRDGDLGCVVHGRVDAEHGPTPQTIDPSRQQDQRILQLTNTAPAPAVPGPRAQAG